jgi:hypothetical protein
VAGADVDIEAFVAAVEAAHEVKVLEPLGVGNDLSCGHVFYKAAARRRDFNTRSIGGAVPTLKRVDKARIANAG